MGFVKSGNGDLQKTFHKQFPLMRAKTLWQPYKALEYLQGRESNSRSGNPTQHFGNFLVVADDVGLGGGNLIKLVANSSF